jgi:hypothetical protein
VTGELVTLAAGESVWLPGGHVSDDIRRLSAANAD